MANTFMHLPILLHLKVIPSMDQISLVMLDPSYPQCGTYLAIS